MTVSGKPFRVFVASFTAVWTTLLCCCALGGHGNAAVAVEVAEQPVAVAPVDVSGDAHGCCRSPAAPESPAPADPVPGNPSNHGCDCPMQSIQKINDASHQALPPLVPQTPALDLLPTVDRLLLDPPAIQSADLPAHGPPVPPATHSLFAQACLLTT